PRGRARGERARVERAGRDREALGAERLRGGDVLRPGADHEHATRLPRRAELRRAARRARAQELRAHLVIAAEAAEPEAIEEPHARELEPRALADVARAEPDGGARGSRGVEHRLDARVHDAIVRPLHLLPEEAQVRRDER